MISEVLLHNFCSVLTLHRVHKKNSSNLQPNENLKAEPEKLYSFLNASKRAGIQFISIDELYYRLTHKETLKKTAVITLDDGYKDNITYGKPIFESTSTPYTIYVTTDMPDKKAKLWWFFLEDQLLFRESITHNGRKICLKKKEQKEKFFLKLRLDILKMESDQIIPFLESIFCCHYDIKLYNDTYAISWNEIIEAQKNSLCTVASHTISHPNLASLEEEKAWEEIQKSKLYIESKTKKSVLHLAYPYGGVDQCSNREFCLAHKANFQTATTTRWGGVFANQTDSLTAIPRIELHTNFSWEKVKMRIAGKLFLNK